MNIIFDKYCYNPLYWHLRKYIADPKIRYIHVFGGSSAGKTFTIAQLYAEIFLKENVNIKIFRKESTTIWDTVYKDVVFLINKLNSFIPVFKIMQKWINKNEYQIKFGGLDDPEKAKGLSQFKYIFLNELNKFTFEDYKEIKRRMRGIQGQKCITDCNPVSIDMWFYKEIIKKDKWLDLPNVITNCIGLSQLSKDSFVKKNEIGNAILIKTTYKDNFWISGHPIDGYGWKDDNTLQEFSWMQKFDEYNYLVYGRGEFGAIKTGNEFWRAFDINKHVKPVNIDNNNTIHISIDNNVLPYIAVSFWQVFMDTKTIRQIDELPCIEPYNTASRAGEKTLNRLCKYGYKGVVLIYGDASTKSRNTIDENKRSFYDLFEEQIKDKYVVRDRIPKSNTSVAMKGEFINALYNNWQEWKIEISEKCKYSISDYVDVKTSKDLTILKKKYNDKQLNCTYEINGHFSDTKKDFICECLNAEFASFQNKGSNHMLYDLGLTEQSGY